MIQSLLPRWLFPCLAVLLALTTGCASTPWTIVRQTQPNPLLDQRNWMVEPMSFENAVVDGEPIGTYLAQRDQARRMGDPRFQYDLRVDLAKMNDAFIVRLRDQPGALHVSPPSVASSADSKSYRIRALIHGVSTGQQRGMPTFGGGSSAPAQAFLTLSLLDPEGREIDVVDLQTEIAPDAAPITGNGPLSECGAAIADLTLDYLATRVDTIPR